MFQLVLNNKIHTKKFLLQPSLTHTTTLTKFCPNYFHSYNSLKAIKEQSVHFRNYWNFLLQSLHRSNSRVFSLLQTPCCSPREKLMKCETLFMAAEYFYQEKLMNNDQKQMNNKQKIKWNKRKVKTNQQKVMNNE